MSKSYPNLLAAFTAGIPNYDTLLGGKSELTALRQGAIRPLTFRIKRTLAGFHWQLVGGNGEIMGNSEVMTRKESVLDAIRTIQSLASTCLIEDCTK